MAGRSFSMTPRAVPKVRAKYRRIVTRIPAPASLAVLKDLRMYEPVSMTGQPPVLWDHAEGVQVYDNAGNMWLDWSSGVLVTGAGHSRKEIVNAVCAQAKKKLLHNYCFPSAERAKLVRRLVEIAPKKFGKAFLRVQD